MAKRRAFFSPLHIKGYAMENLKFKNGSFRIMQIADVQEDWPLNPDTVKLIHLAVKKEKPDLVVFTGDQIQGYSPCYKSDAEEKVRRAIATFTTPITEEGIPFTMTFGNHDDDCNVKKSIQRDFYASIKGFVAGEPRHEDDPGTHYINIKDSEGKKDIFALYLIDSNKKESDGSYSPVKKEQLEWLEKVRKENNYLPALLFQHIPVPEFYDVLEKVPFYKKGRVEAYKSRKNTFWCLPGKDGFMGETPAVPEINTGEFDLIKKHGDILGLFVGHDHNNSFVRNKDGIDLGYTQGAGFNTYGPGDKRGVRVFVLDESNLGSYETHTVTIGELCDYKPSKPFQEFVYRNAPTCVDQVKTGVKRFAIAGVAVGVIATVIKRVVK